MPANLPALKISVELKASISKYDSFVTGLTQQDTPEGISMLKENLNNVSTPWFSSKYDSTTTSYDDGLSDYLFYLEQCMIYDVCGLL